MTEKYVGSDKLYMAGEFANLGEALKKIYPNKMFEDQINRPSPFREALKSRRYHPDLMGENLECQIGALLGECPNDNEGMPPDAMSWLADQFDRKTFDYARLNAWRDGTLDDYEADRARRKANRRPKGAGKAHHPAAKRASSKTRRTHRRPRSSP